MPISTSAGASGATLVWRRHGRYQLTAVIKATFALVPGGVMTAVAPEPIAHDEQEDAAGLRTAGDLVPFRGQADVLVTGHTFVPRSAAATTVPVRLSVLRDGASVLEKALSLQVPARSHPGSVRLFGLGPLSRRWPVRSQLLGSHDPRLFEGASIELPATFDESYFQAAPPDQRLDGLRGDDWIAIDGVRPKGARIETRLPGMRATARLHDPASELQGGRPLHLVLDTLHLDLDLMVCNVTWRGVAAVARAADLASMHVSATVEPTEAEAEPEEVSIEVIPESQIFELGNEDVFDSTLNLGPGQALPEVTRPTPPAPPESEPGFARGRFTGQPSFQAQPARLAETPLPALKEPPPPPRPPPPRAPPARGVPWAPIEPLAAPMTGVELELQEPVERENPLGSTATLSPDAVLQLFAARATPFAPGAEVAPLTARVPLSPFAARRPEPDERTAVHPMMKTLTLEPDDAQPFVVAEKAAPFGGRGAGAPAAARQPASPFAARRSDPDEQTAIHPLSTTEPLGPDEVKKILAERVTPFTPAAAPPKRSFEPPPLMAVLAPVPALPATSFATPALMPPIEPAPTPARAFATPALTPPIELAPTPLSPSAIPAVFESAVPVPASKFAPPAATAPPATAPVWLGPAAATARGGAMSFGAHFLAALEIVAGPSDQARAPGRE